MVVSCSVSGCKNRGGQFDKNGVKIGWHRFPHRDQDLLTKWVEAMGRPGWKPNDSSHVCSGHFVAADYVFCPGAKSRRLKPETVPSVFKRRGVHPLGVVRKKKKKARLQTLLVLQPVVTSGELTETADGQQCVADYLIPEVEYSEVDSVATLTFQEQPPPAEDCSEGGVIRTYSKKTVAVTLQLQEKPATPPLAPPPRPAPVVIQQPRRVYFKRPPKPRPFQQPLTAHRKVAIEHDHQYSQDNHLSTSNRSDVYVTKLEESVRKLHTDLAKLKKDQLLLKQANGRKSRLIVTLNRRIAELAQTINGQQQATGAENMSKLMQMLMDNGQRNASRVAQGRQYSREMRQFCRTVHHFSPPAYRFLKEGLYLPDPRSLRKWASESNAPQAEAVAAEEQQQQQEPSGSAVSGKDEGGGVAAPSGGAFADIDFSHLEDGPDEVAGTVDGRPDRDPFAHLPDGGVGAGGQEVDCVGPAPVHGAPVAGPDLDFSHLERELEVAAGQAYCRIGDREF